MKRFFAPLSHFFAVLVATAACCFLFSCSSPSTRFFDAAGKMGLTPVAADGSLSQHLLLFSNADKKGNTLHVYLDGDGSPWLRRTVIASDPTPRNFLVLHLMHEDPAPSVYLGRPCYNGFAFSEQCEPSYWTNKRYSEEVIQSLEIVLRKVLTEYDKSQMILTGFSGGGALAMLLAPRFEQTKAVVTIAANIDTEKWITHHGYSPLEGSLNPAEFSSLPESIFQLHLLGGKDTVVPVTLAQGVIDQGKNAVTLVYPDFNHSCCWQEVWPDILNRLEHALKKR